MPPILIFPPSYFLIFPPSYFLIFRAYFKALVDESLVEQLLEDPPHTLHEARVQRLVPIVKVDPTAQAMYSLLPLFRVPRPCEHQCGMRRFRICNGLLRSNNDSNAVIILPHHNAPALLIVYSNAHVQNIVASLDVCKNKNGGLDSGEGDRNQVTGRFVNLIFPKHDLHIIS